MAVSAPGPSLLASLLDDEADSLLWFDARARVGWCNASARRRLGASPGEGAGSLAATLGDAALHWLRDALGSDERRETLIHVDDGPVWRLALRPLEGGHSLRAALQLPQALP
ncbi:MAG: hypothetical protein KGL43_02705, partial [Burkholderiales bacterium]|nr:hypothetical protein [Burkholderiales bacterium]